jgi:hypothetical protein
LLPSAGIFGANASGKSNIVRALAALISFARDGATASGHLPILFPKFGLDKSSLGPPTSFELRATLDGAIFTYLVEISRAQIMRESLEMIPSAPSQMRNRLLFKRTWLEDQMGFQVENGPDFNDAYRQIQESLRHHEPFLSILTTKLKVDAISRFTEWLSRSYLGAIGTTLDLAWGGTLDRRLFGGRLADDPHMLHRVERMVRTFDTGIASLEVRRSSGRTPTLWPSGEGSTQDAWAPRDLPGMIVKHTLNKPNRPTNSPSVGRFLALPTQEAVAGC